MPKPNSLDANIIYLCSQFAHRFGILMTSEFHRNNISVTAEQFSVLVLLWYKDGITQKEISEGISRDKTTVVRVLKNMYKGKLIVYKKHPEDNRSKLVFVSEKGKTLQDITLQISGTLYNKMLDGIPPGKLKTSIEVMKEMISNF